MTEFQKTGDMKLLLSSVMDEAATFSSGARATGASLPLRREDLRLICFEHISC